MPAEDAVRLDARQLRDGERERRPLRCHHRAVRAARERGLQLRTPDSFVADAESIRRTFAEQGPAELVFVAQQYLEAGAWDQALALCEAFDELESPALSLCRAVATFVSGDRATALALVESVLERSPHQLSALGVKAQMLARSGSGSAALPALRSLLESCPDYPGAQSLLGALLMPGPPYREVLAKIHERLRPRSYLEIGVDTGATLALAHTAELAIGIDPAEVRARQPLPKSARLFRETSDQFFAGHTLKEVLGERRLDLVFIDGMHRFENALADFMNAEAWAHPGATIVLHDCMPLLASHATRERKSSFWVGDTWKVVFALAIARPDLRIRSIPCVPSGLVVVRRLNPNSNTLGLSFQAIVEQLQTRVWEREFAEFPAEFCVVANDASGLADALA